MNAEELIVKVNRHLGGQGCPKCNGCRRTTDDFIKIFKGKYDKPYSFEKTDYKNSNTKVCVTCEKHDDFYITPHMLLRGQGCPKCGRNRIGKAHSDTQETFLQKAKEKGLLEKYDFSNIVYERSNCKIQLYCGKQDKCGKEHGIFYITPNDLLNGHGCPKCSKVYRRTQDELIEDFRIVHGDKYDYSKVEFKNMRTKVCMICPEHGEFWQLPDSHIRGQGCPQCKMSHMENNISQLLKDNDIEFEYESNINGLLQRKSVDFYIPKYNLTIECQGGQHFYGGFNRKDKVKANNIHYTVLRRDIEKKKILDENNIRILYYSDVADLPNDIFFNKKYKKIYNTDNFYTEKEELLRLIKQN